MNEVVHVPTAVLPAASPVPFVDLQAQHAEVADAVADGWSEVTHRTAFVMGPQVKRFERTFADFSGVRHCVGVNSGTDALEFAIRALGVESGDEVILPTNSFIATAAAVARAGARPVLVDIDPATYLMDPERVAGRIGRRTRAIVPVHLYGQTAPVETFRALCEDGVSIVEDAAQSQGARRHGVAAGGLGDLAATSFYPGKNLGAYGDAGAVLTNDDELAARVRALGDHGSTVKYHHPELGFNSRMDTLQAVVLSAKLDHLADWNARRRAAAARYDELLRGLDEVVTPVTLAGNEHVWHLYVVRVPRRNEIVRRLNDGGIGVGIHYPVPIHLQGAFRGLGHAPGDFPQAERAASEILSLPMFPHISTGQQERVVEALRRALG